MIKLQHLAKYGRRNIAESTSGIGNWMQIMSVVAYLSVPINLIILLVARFPTVVVGAAQKEEELLFEEKSSLVQYFEKRDPEFWTYQNIVIAAVIVEHVIIAIKILVGIVIPDVPQEVIDAERARNVINSMAVKEMQRIKIDGNHESFDDI